MNILIAGLGSTGRRHLSNLRVLEPGAETIILHQRATPDSPGLSDEFGRHVFSIKDALKTKPQAALITSPASRHIRTAIELARAGVHLFIEKPLSTTLEQVDELLAACRRRNLTLMVGYNFRFYPPFELIKETLDDGRIGRVLSMRAEVGQFLPDWRPGIDYRTSVSASDDLSGGVVLELSHELEYARRLLGEVTSVMAHVARLGDLEIDTDDTADIILKFSNGAVGNIHLDMTQRSAIRTCRITGTEGTITWDWETHRVRLFAARHGAWQDLNPAQEIDRNEMYVAELRHFLDCVKGNAIPPVNGDDGRRVLEIALAAKESSRKQQAIQL